VINALHRRGLFLKNGTEKLYDEDIHTPHGMRGDLMYSVA
jgi:hypothetical protein